MPHTDRTTNPPPEKPGGEGWLVNPEQQLVCQFKADIATVYAQLVVVVEAGCRCPSEEKAGVAVVAAAVPY